MERIYIIILALALLTACSGSSGDSLANGLTGTGGSMARFTAKGDYLYVVDNSSLKTFDLSTPEHPRHLPEKTQNLGFGVETIFPTDSFLFIGSMSGMFVYSIQRPEFPQYVSHVSHITSCDPVAVSGNYAYVTLYSGSNQCMRMVNELHIYDISDIKNPRLAHREPGLTHPQGLGIEGDKLYVCDNGLKIFDISKPDSPVWTGDAGHIEQLRKVETYDLIPLGGSLLLVGSGGLYQFDSSGDKLSLISIIPVSDK